MMKFLHHDIGKSVHFMMLSLSDCSPEFFSDLYQRGFSAVNIPILFRVKTTMRKIEDGIINEILG